MVVDGFTFLKRAQWFFVELKSNRYPNASQLASSCRCSKNTAQRTIYRLRDEFLVPIEYDGSQRGYYLSDKNYTFPISLPPGKDELAALLFAREFLSSVEAKDVKELLDVLWGKFAASNTLVARELEPLSGVFSCDSTVIGDLADRGLLTFVNAAYTGELLRINYKSPWRHDEAKSYEGQVVRVHFSDGSLYLLFDELSGRRLIFNASFVRKVEIMSDGTAPRRSTAGPQHGAENWLDGFGIWSGESLEQVEIRIRPPAAEYYAAQRWHEDQIDSWEDGQLVRKFPGMVSPELVRRILSLGQYLSIVKPKALAGKALADAKLLVEALEESAKEERDS